MGPRLGPHFFCDQRLTWLSRIDIASIGHIHQDAFAGFVDTQGFAFFVDMIDHQFSNVKWIGGKSPFAHAQLLKLSKQVLVEFGAFDDGEGHAEDRKHTGGYKVLPDGDGLFTHILGCASGHGQIGDAVAQATGFDHFSAGNQNAAVVDTGTQAQHRRHTHGLTDFFQPGPARWAASGVVSPAFASAICEHPV